MEEKGIGGLVVFFVVRGIGIIIGAGVNILICFVWDRHLVGCGGMVMVGAALGWGVCLYIVGE